MVAKIAAVATVTEEQIRAIAHQLWMEAGQPEGQAEEHWFKAIEVASIKAGKSAKAKPGLTKSEAIPITKKAASKKQVQ